jgi:hypothetical protein
MLPNRTYPFAYNKGYYIVNTPRTQFTDADPRLKAELSVFHHLHCLVSSPEVENEADVHQDERRRALHPEYYLQIKEKLPHVNHCVEAMRQSLMCSADISVIVWQWDKIRQRALARANIVHTCRNFDKILEWSKKNRAREQFAAEVYLDDDLNIPTF